MIILPAIDLKDGKCVRLQQGRADAVTVYSDNPIAQARKWVEQGAEQLHIVDLDGAFNGSPAHAQVIAKIVTELAIPVEVGGGLRTDIHVEEVLAAGAARAIIGTRALEHPEALEPLVRRFGGERIAVGIDARNGLVQTKGWVHTSDTLATDLAKMVARIGVKTIIYTDTATDGMLSGTNVPAMDEMCAAVPSVNIIVSGGVSTPEAVRELCALKRKNLFGAIVGKALYDGVVTLKQIQQAASL